MAKRQFKAESKRLLDLMINSIYTHKEIFLREIISNASDACDKLCYQALTDDAVGMSRKDFKIEIKVDKEHRTLTVSDNGIGMDKEDLENNLGVIASSGSYKFKQEVGDDAKDTDVIGQFGVGFYSAFMVADHITVVTRKYGADAAWMWQSSGADGYTITECERDAVGTDIIMHIKADTDDEKYSEFLESWRLQELVRKYSDYIRFPIRMEVSKTRRKEGSPDDKPEYETYVSGRGDAELHGAHLAAAQVQREAGGVQQVLSGQVPRLRRPPKGHRRVRRGRRHLQGAAVHPRRHPLRLLHQGV